MMDLSTEIRKLSREYTSELTRILEYGEQWKRLMAIIPKTLLKTDYKCNITYQNRNKYRSEHFIMIEEHSKKTRRTCTDVLFDEWGTSGRVRPALGHLMHLLVKAELFRAADYIAVTLLGLPPPERPTKGPSAPVMLNEHDLEVTKIEKILDQIDYPSSAIENILKSSINTNINYSTNQQRLVVPEIVVIESSSDDTATSSLFNVPLVVPKNKESDEVSDMIKFSSNSIKSDNKSPPSFDETSTANIPNFSLINNSSSDHDNSETTTQSLSGILPNLSLINSSNESTEDSVKDFEMNLPNFTVINNSKDVIESSENFQENLPNLSFVNQSDDSVSSERNLPNFNLMMIADSEHSTSASINMANFSLTGTSETTNSSSDKSIETTSTYYLSDTNLPAFSQLIDNNNRNSLERIVSCSTNPGVSSSETTNSRTRPCVSPLPNLSLNTLLPHFTYSELELATNSFDVIDVKDNGRLLGAGAFGKVYLALGLLDKPIAVKRMMLNNVEFVSVDDTITKQFRNEVEVLSRYKHDNLLSLIGYSCDGCTYCLLYEYLRGGALKDRLQSPENRLIWTERLYIALGTSKAISYLHTAFSTPLIHRDIKTANILLDDTNKPKLCDFGLIKLSPNQNTNTATTVFGTSAYMAPEAFRGDISVKLDTFSFGVVLLELLTSLPPLDQNRDGHDLVTFVENNCEDDISPLLDRNAGSWCANTSNFAADLFTIARKCLEEKKKRPNMVEITSQLSELTQKYL